MRRLGQGKVIRDVRVERRQRQGNAAAQLLPLRKALRRDFVDLVRRVDEIGRLVVRLIRADEPDARVLRRHGIQTFGDRLRIITIGQVRRVQRMLNRHAQHRVHQPFDVVHVARDRRITEIQVQNMRDFIEVALLDAFAAQHFQVVENGGDDFVALGQAFVGQETLMAKTPPLRSTIGSAPALMASASPCFCNQSDSVFLLRLPIR